MESWRERGYVPDSDEEDFDSQDAKKLSKEDEREDVEDVGSGNVEEGTAQGSREDEDKGKWRAGEDGDGPRGEESGQDTDDEVDTAQEDGREGTQSMAFDEGRASTGSTKDKTADEETDSQAAPRARNTEGHNSSSNVPAARNPSPPSTPRAQQPANNVWDVPSSSPDELQMDFPSTQKPIPLPPRPNFMADRTQPPNEDVDDSPLSSPPSSLRSMRLDENEQDKPEGALEPEHSVEDLLPPLDIPEDVLQELSQPGRRSLRQRNPIQLHPYLLEDAKYQRLMKARGVKPVRIAQYQQALREAAAANEDSQGQEFAANDAGPPSSSPAADYEPPPSLSPAEPQQTPARQLHQGTPGSAPRRNHQPPSHSPNTPVPHSVKRRKMSHSDKSHQRQRGKPQAEVIVDNSAPPGLGNTSIFDIPPSPPRSESITSARTTHPQSGFRFPRGTTPPALSTPVTESRLDTGNADDGGAMDWSAPNADNDSAGEKSTSSHSQPNSDGKNDQANQANQDRAVRALQRKIKGVLPASWLRLDQQKQQERWGSTQHRDKASHRPENGKGVAKKVTKRSGTGGAPNARAQLTSLSHLADDDNDESDNNASSAKENPHLTLAEVVGFEDPFQDQDMGDDIPEDNRIDNMFPPAPRSPPTSRNKTQGTKRQKPQHGSIHIRNQLKRPRLKRQTRLTDPVFEGRRTRRSSTKIPGRPPKRVHKLGILDAPDVAEQPRQQQPQFLRVAARQARSRRDRGRRSPTRKVFDLSSRNDTEDANMQLRQWRKGQIRQTRLTEPQRRAQRRPPLVDLSTNGRDVPEDRSIRQPRGDSVFPTGTVQPEDNSDASASTPRPDTPAPVPTLQKTAQSRKPTQPQMQGNKWVIRRNLAVSSLKRNTPRPAGLEIENTGSNMSPSLFHRSLSMLNQDYRNKRSLQGKRQNLTMDRFLSDSVSSAAPRAVQEVAHGGGPTALNDTSSSAQPPARRRQLKKRPPKRLDLEVIEHQEPPIVLSPDPVPSVMGVDDVQSDRRASSGLYSFQYAYTIDFDVTPLCPGTFFHESTFVGSGEFARSLDLLSRDLDEDAGVFHMNIGSRNLRWGAWNDTVSSELGLAFEKLTEGIETDTAASHEADSEGNINQPHGIYRSIIKYVTENLSFIDPVDRTGFATRAYDLVSGLNYHLATLTSTSERNIGCLTRIASYDVVFANQIFQVARNGLVSEAIANETLELVKSVSKQAVAFLSSPSGLTDIRMCLDEQRVREKREVGIRDDHPAVEAYAVVQHVLRGSDRFKGWFESFVTEGYLLSDAGDLSNSKDVSSLENGWSSVFTPLSLNEFDRSGIARIGSRFRGAHDNWTVVKQLLRPVLDEYDPNLMAQPISYNSYCRALFHRCFHLINGWGWRDCKPILDTLYDFFAKNTLYNLKHEESFGSPAFLEELDRNPSLEVRPGEPCFHVLLKIIASGLRLLSMTYDKKKIRNFAWRLLPNHGRVYPKEMPIRHEDLDALRNHHDLLCTLYFAVPDGCRPRLEAIKNLVHPASSHRETCDISIRSWIRLARFKLSTDEDVSGLDPFADWHNYLITELLRQHSLARKEIEAQGDADDRFSKQVIESTISQNQRQIESLLNNAIGGLRSTLQLAPSLEHARRIVSKMSVKAILGLFNSRVPRLNATVSEALQLVTAYIQKCGSPDPAPAPVSTDDDSQEYGDWTAIEAMYGDEVSPANEGVEHVDKVFHPAVSRLVSNCFGEDHSPEDKILLDIVDCWTSIAQVLVSHKLRHWDNFLSPYDGDSWASLRSTVQTRKFTPQFLASCVEKDSGLISQCKPQVLGMWMSTLVERTSMLKFQHRLTGALLNEMTMDPLIENLPFSKDPRDGRFSITLENFSQRRLSLISSLLSNMREHLQDLEDTESPNLSITKEEYRELIQQLISSMKANYQELGNSGQSVQGAYVDFVHRVVGFLQQHSREICPIDPFFTDPTSFPLPSTDPSYIVARLKSYEPKLSAEKVARALITFVQGVSERAAIDGQQVYLVDQLTASMADTYEAGTPNRPTLRGILLQCVFPAYLENAFSNAAAWILSLPILQAISRTFNDLLFNIDTTDPNCVSSVVNIIRSTLQSSYQALRRIADNPEILRNPQVLVTATAFVETITATLLILDYIHRVADTPETDNAISQARTFHPFALFAVFHLRGLSSLSIELKGSFITSSPAFTTPHPSTAAAETTLPRFFHEARHSASHELHMYLAANWSRHQGKYYFIRRGGHQPQEVGIEASVAARLENSPGIVFEDAVSGLLRAYKGLGVFDG